MNVRVFLCVSRKIRHQLFSGLVFAAALLVSDAASAATVLGTAGPYDPTNPLNLSLDYGIHDNTAPTAVPVNPSDNITITYASGLTSAFGGPGAVDANGYIGGFFGSGPGRSGIGGSTTFFPSYYLDPTNSGTPVNLNQLMGSFVNASGGVLQAFAIGNGPFSITAPGGTAFLLLGFNDDIFADNTGFLNVDVTGSSALATPLPAALPLFATGFGILSVLGWRRKRKSAAALTVA
jgi:hypothetical protein